MIMVNSRTGENQIVAVLGANDEVAISDVDHAVQSGKFSQRLFSCQFEVSLLRILRSLNLVIG